MSNSAFLAPFALLVPTALAVAAPQEQGAGADPIEQDAARIAEALDGGWNIDVGGYLIASWLHATNSDKSAASIDAIRVFVEGELGGWRLLMGVRGEISPSRGYFAQPGTTGNLRAVDTYATREVLDDVRVTVGKFRPPFVSSANYELNRLLFNQRSFIGSEWDFYGTGAMLDARIGPLRGWLSAQNGLDNFGSDTALTLRGVWDVVGEGAGREWEGTYESTQAFNLSLGGAIYYDTNNDDATSQAAEISGTFGPWYFAAEAVDSGDGLGDLFSWAITNAFRIGHDDEVALRFEDFDRDDSADLVRVGYNHYFQGHDAKIQATYSTADSNAPVADSDVIQVGLAVSF